MPVVRALPALVNPLDSRGQDVIVKGERPAGKFLRFVTLCSTEEAFDKACHRFSKALQTRGYSTHEVKNVQDMIKWENTGEILKRREDKKKGTGEAPGIAVVIADKPGLRRCW